MAEWEITSAALIITVILVRCLVKEKITLRMRYAMWLIVMIRLLVPFMVTDSRFSIMNYTGRIEINFEDNQRNTDNIVEVPYDKQQDGTFVTQKPQIQYKDFSDKTESSSDNKDIIQITDKKTSAGDVLLSIWLCVMITGFLAVSIMNIRFYIGLKKSRRIVKQDIIKEVSVYETKMVNSPCLFGIFKPCIYLNTVSGDKKTLEHILTHEYTHYRHFDYIWSFMRVICVCIHWFNPFVWLAAYISASDCELACDEGAIRIIGEENRIAYGETLINAAAAVNGIQGALLGATAMLEGKRSLKERVVCIAKKHMNSRTAVIAVFAAAIVALLCTFTGMYDGLDVNKLEKKLLEAGGYDKGTEYELFESDYDADGRMDSFIVVYNEEKPEEAEESAEYNVDIWYYDGSTGSLVNHIKNEYLPVSKEHMHIEELTDKTFFIYDVPYTVMRASHVMGIRNGEVTDYFETIEGTFKGSDGNDIEISIFPVNAGSIDGMFYGRTVMPQYLHYDAESDMIITYKAYAITRYEAEKIENVSEILESIKNTYAEMGRNYDISFAIRNDLLHIMIKVYTDETSSYYYETYDCEYYTYRIENNSIGELLSYGAGFYDDIDEESEKQVNTYENEDMNIRYKTFENLRDDYLSAAGENVIYSSIIEDDGGSSARLLYYLLNDDYSITVREEYYTLLREEDGYSVKSSEVLINEEIRSSEDFARVYVYFPDFFAMGLTKYIINDGIEEYKTPENSAVLFFRLYGGSAQVMDTASDNRKSIVYTFADGSQTEISMYRTYDGIWLPASEYGSSYASAQINEWYRTLTEKDFEAAARYYDNMTSEEVINCNVIIWAEFPEYGVKIYGSGNGGGIVADYQGKRYLYTGRWLTTRTVFPEFEMYDYDNDGLPEIAVKEYYASGTGVSIEGLSVIDSVYEMFDTMYGFANPEDFINDELEYEADGTVLDFGLKGADEKYTVLFSDIIPGMTEGSFLGITTGDVISYEFSQEGTVNIYAGIQVYGRNIVMGQYISNNGNYPCEIMADVKYEGNGIFKMTNFRFSKDRKEYKQ